MSIITTMSAINAAEARAHGLTLDEILRTALIAATSDVDVTRRLRLWYADCAAHVLHLFEGQSIVQDNRPRESIAAARKYARGELTARAATRAVTWDNLAESNSVAWDAARAALRAVHWEPTDTPGEDAATAARDAVWAAAWGEARDHDNTWPLSLTAKAWEENWQFDRLIERLSINEPADIRPNEQLGLPWNSKPQDTSNHMIKL